MWQIESGGRLCSALALFYFVAFIRWLFHLFQECRQWRLEVVCLCPPRAYPISGQFRVLRASHDTGIFRVCKHFS
jgi:hypothetical protein